jgi:hypothetical protein
MGCIPDFAQERRHPMDSILMEQIDQVVAEFQQRVHHQASQIDPSSPGVLLDLERTLFFLLMQVGAALVAALLGLGGGLAGRVSSGRGVCASLSAAGQDTGSSPVGVALYQAL